MAKVSASASIKPPISPGIREGWPAGRAFIFLGNGDRALHLRVNRAVIGVGPGFGKGGREARPSALQAGLEATIVGRRVSRCLRSSEPARRHCANCAGILQVLRQVDEVEPRGPAPGLAQLSILIETTTQAGVPTKATVVGTARRLPPAIDLAAYRIIQESMTNVVRHAGRASAEVTVAYEPSRIVIEVSDDGRGTTASDGDAGGHGISGMRERVGAAGGGMQVGPKDGRGFRVRVWLPTNGMAP